MTTPQFSDKQIDDAMKHMLQYVEETSLVKLLQPTQLEELKMGKLLQPTQLEELKMGEDTFFIDYDTDYRLDSEEDCQEEEISSDMIASALEPFMKSIDKISSGLSHHHSISSQDGDKGAHTHVKELYSSDSMASALDPFMNNIDDLDRDVFNQTMGQMKVRTPDRDITTKPHGAMTKRTDEVEAMNQQEFDIFCQKVDDAKEFGFKPFWEKPEFEESDFEIVDNEFRFKTDLHQVSPEAVEFFNNTLKPLANRYLAKHPIKESYSDGIDDDYERAMGLLK